MTYRWEVMVAVVGMFLMLGVGTVVHFHKIQKAQRWLLLPMLAVMLSQIKESAGLINAKTGKQTTSRYQQCQQKCDHRLHESYLTRLTP